MKFFSELGSCCRAPAPEPETEVSSGLLTNVGRVSGPKSSTRRRSSGQWRPGLSMISEDGVASAAERRRERVAGSEKKASQEGGSRGRVRRTSDSEEYSKLQLQMIIPAFSPTPFLF
ncbi:uncharacterized protein LOC117927053 [Vitis riparia]|uniref:uncharacterized protein LOC117927053 n=1 Tax=Vitis riparia TaxID=96939 RepID=UPI00155A5946|nr:uncharacterized protein LOC117927053 [Vitis riparia]